jgi:hypothetical protein
LVSSHHDIDLPKENGVNFRVEMSWTAFARRPER